ncbi:MAG: PTS sugar transporter subunit IIA [Lachnospiraceae bacterium]|nr:PTS sugar transporter subunit IIA [Lachnospiraceae bacterium]
MIWEELDKSLIMTDLDVTCWEDVMKEIGGTLTKEGYTKDSYVDALIAREKEYPTGLDIDGIGVAIPHTDVSHVNKAGIAIGVLKEPVTFVQMGTDDETAKVGVVFMLSVVDPNKHMDHLQRIITIIQDKNVLNQLLEAKETDEIIEIIKEKENTL